MSHSPKGDENALQSGRKQLNRVSVRCLLLQCFLPCPSSLLELHPPWKSLNWSIATCYDNSYPFVTDALKQKAWVSKWPPPERLSSLNIRSFSISRQGQRQPSEHQDNTNHPRHLPAYEFSSTRKRQFCVTLRNLQSASTIRVARRLLHRTWFWLKGNNRVLTKDNSVLSDNWGSLENLKTQRK